MKSKIRVALVHDWLTGMRGGEYVLEAIAEIFPKAELFTLIYIPGKISPVLTTLKKHTSWLQKIPNIENNYRYFLPVLPKVIESFDLTGFDLVISTSHCVAKGIKKPEGAVHVSYIFAPMRYVWDRYEDYFGSERASAHVRLAARLVRKRLQNWDKKVSSPARVDHLITLSHYIESQIKTHYHREAQVIYPFAQLENFSRPRVPGRNYLIVSAFAPYKRLDLAIEAFNRLKLPLLIVGSGQDEARLRKLAGPSVEFLGGLSNSAIADLYSKCKAFVFPGLEDFGITPLEAMASGAPVIAYGVGGVTETVTDKTGIFFAPQTVEALMEAVLKVEKGEAVFSPEECRAQAARFTRERFQSQLIASLKRSWQAAGKDPEALEETLKLSWQKTAPDT
jgi:glycosyltransferase involved in cell wall biosynthesis